MRIHASIESSGSQRWLEVARAQVHGYDCVDAKFLSDLRVASIADEKVTRIFDAPGAFVSLLETLGVRSGGEDIGVCHLLKKCLTLT